LLQEGGFHTKFLSVGSTAGLSAVTRNECDLAGIHLLDVNSGQYNHPYITAELLLLPGYRRLQGVVYRAGDRRFENLSATDAIERAKRDPTCMMVNRNQGSGTRILIDRLLEGTQPNGYAVQARNHTAVAAAVLQGRADWGVAVDSVSRHKDLRFLPIGDEHYDFIVPQYRLQRPAIQAFRKLLVDPQVRAHLSSMGLRPSET
jgi:putative molybdopterin biosynthesis protein